MIYFCADDYGLNSISSTRILQCVKDGCINKVSVFPNFNSFDLDELIKENVRLSVHLNLVEGKCLANADELSLLTDKNGNFKNTFVGLLKLNIFHKKKLEKQLYKEIMAQVRFWKNALPNGVDFCIDSHQHTHMIPAVFKSLLNVLKDENITPEYIRIPTEPILPFIKTPSLYLTYSAVNVIKQWLLKFLWLFNKNKLKKQKIPTAKFFGILFSGKMDEARVSKILPHYINSAKKRGMDIEVLFHPGYLEESEIELENITFSKFYLSKNRKTEFNSVIKLAERSVL